MTLRHHLRITQGETWSRAFPIYVDIDNGLVGASARGQIRSGPHGSTALHTWSADEDNIELTNEAIILYVPAAVSSSWSWTSGLWDLELTDVFGTVTRLVEGFVWVNPEITR